MRRKHVLVYKYRFRLFFEQSPILGVETVETQPTQRDDVEVIKSYRVEPS